MVSRRQTAVIPKERAIKLTNSTAEQFRRQIVEFSKGRSAANDALIVYFSGHATTLTDGDLGLCFVDTVRHQEFGNVLSASTVRVSDVAATLAAVRVNPIFIIDACESGQAASAILSSEPQLRKKLDSSFGTTFALLCSSQADETTPDMFDGGPFSRVLTETLRRGSDVLRTRALLSLQDMVPALRIAFEQRYTATPLMHLGETLPEYPVVKNTRHKPRSERFGRSNLKTLLLFWHDGQPKDLSVHDLRDSGSTPHTTYSKLSYAPGWGLIVKHSRERISLTDRGVAFLKGRTKIPQVIVNEGNGWHAGPNSDEIDVSEVS